MKKLICTLSLCSLLLACSPQNHIPERPENAVIQGVNYIGKVVNDIDSTTEFYAKAVDLVTVEQKSLVNSPVMAALAGRDDVLIETRLLRSSNTQLRLMQFKSPSELAKATKTVPVNGPGFAHVAFQADATTQAYEKFLSQGAKPIGDPKMARLSSSSPVSYAYSKDIDNTTLEVEHVDIDLLDRKTPPKNKYRIRHVALATPDFDRIKDFYSILLEQDNPRVLGRFLKLSGDKVDAVSGLKDSKLRMGFFHIRNLELEIAQYFSHPTTSPTNTRPIDALGYNMIVFDVSDLTLAKQRLLTAGGTVETDIQQLDGGKIFFGRDPDKNLLGFQLLDSNSLYSAKNFANDGSS